jgi:hypothetical protein
MRKYLTYLITEKGVDLESEVRHDGLTYQMLIDFICNEMKEHHKRIRETLVKIDFMNGDVFHYLHYISNAAV